jgi:tRNA 2-thiocytidine biosynthesis protein TtcA
LSGSAWQESVMSQQDNQEATAPDRTDNRKDRLEFNKLRKRLRRQMGKAIADFNLIEAGDRVMVVYSGGKDSHAMLELLISLRSSAPIDFDIVAVTLDQKQPGYPEEVLPAYLGTTRHSFLHFGEGYLQRRCARLFPKGKTTCGLCSRPAEGERFMDLQSRLARTKLPWDIIETIS